MNRPAAGGTLDTNAKEARARIAVASWPFRKLVNPKTGTVKLVDFPAFISDRFGVPGIEPLSRHFPSGSGRGEFKGRCRIRRTEERSDQFGKRRSGIRRRIFPD